MPIPKPRDDESQGDFHSRCMSKLVGDEGKLQDQANAICYSAWESKNEMRKTKVNRKKAATPVIEVKESFQIENDDAIIILEKGDRIKVMSKSTAKKESTEFVFYDIRDTTAAREINLFIHNDDGIYRRHVLPAIANMKKKMQAGTYNPELAPKLWLYVVEAAVKAYSPGDRPSDIMAKSDRIGLAKYLADLYYEEIEMGNW